MEKVIAYKGHDFRVTLKDNPESDALKVDVTGRKSTIKVIWDTNKYPDQPYLVGHKHDTPQRRVLQKWVVGILRELLQQVVSANHGGRSTEVKDAPYISQGIYEGHLRVPYKRTLQDGTVVIVAATVVNKDYLPEDTRTALMAEAALLTKVSKAYGIVVTDYHTAKEMDEKKGGK